MSGDIRVSRHSGLAWKCPFSRRELLVVLEAMRASCGLGEVPVDLILADDAFISAVNAERLGCAGPTNVLSFPPAPGFGPSGGRALLLLSVDTLERECLLYGQDPKEHTLRLVAHGLAHVGGLDHGPALDALQQAAMAAGMHAAIQANQF